MSRPLPARPDLELERKEAKKLLRHLRGGDPDALRRAADLGIRAATGDPRSFKLADAQFAIAREYGFASWPRLVEYFETLKRHERSGTFDEKHPLSFWEERVDGVFKGLEMRHAFTGRLLAAFVPRLGELTLEEVFATELTREEARLVVAREARCASWEALVARAGTPPDGWAVYTSPRMLASRAVRHHDQTTLEALAEAHPELLTERWTDSGHAPLAYDALLHEYETRSEASRRITDWLESRGADLEDALNHMLLGYMGRMETERARFLLERGADPSWVAPNGIPVLEHALFRYRNGEAVDLIAQRVVPREAFWIAAGLGDVRSLPRYVGPDGMPTEAALRVRPDFMALAPHTSPSLPSDEPQFVVSQAFRIAAQNGRFDVLDFLLQRGFPVDYVGSPRGGTALFVAVVQSDVALVEHLLSHGADPSFGAGQETVRGVAENQYLWEPDDPARLRVLELCGGRSPGELAREQAGKRAAYDEKLARVLAVSEHGRRILAAAREEAERLGQAEVRPDNLFVAMLRGSSLVIAHLFEGGVNIEQLRLSLGDRLTPLPSPQNLYQVPFDAEMNALLKAAETLARERRQRHVGALHWLYEMTRLGREPIAGWITAAGGRLEMIEEECARGLGHS
jgi:hypothetical protein